MLTILKSFKKDKTPGPDGWTPDFFIHFADIFLDYITGMVEEMRITVKVSGVLNSTFFVLIPKKDHPTSFNDYTLIFLCNTLYKIVSKTIANRLK